MKYVYTGYVFQRAPWWRRLLFRLRWFGAEWEDIPGCRCSPRHQRPVDWLGPPPYTGHR